jgi:hypothetical protein
MLKRYIVVLLSFFMLFACEKVREDIMTDGQDPAGIVTIKSLVEQANDRYLGVDVVNGRDDIFLSSENEGLIDEYIASEEGFTDARPLRNTLLVCLRSVEPDRDQRLQIGRALRAYSMRNERLIYAHRQTIRNLQERIGNARQELMDSLEAGEIDREQYRRKILTLRERYQEAIKRIRVSNAEAFSRSYRMFLENLNQILSQEQWKAFTGCLTSR